MKKSMQIFREVLRQNRTAVILWGIFSFTGFAVFALYRIRFEAFLYSAAVTLFFLCVFLAVGCSREKVNAEKRSAALSAIDIEWNSLPPAHSASEEDYQKMIGILGSRLEGMISQFHESQQDSLDYYTAWVHQIKTPIAVMKLKLAEDTSENRALSAELFRIEQYVDMALQYIRLGSTTNDLVIREYDLDSLLKESIHKFAPLFIEKKLRLDYVPTGKTLVTDKKWFACIVDQLLSNAVKYTPSGTISIRLDGDRLIIGDTGIGIAPEDLPRIFEKGYTGRNGRIGEKSSGLGLYLAKKAANMLSLPLRAESDLGAGSRFILDLRQDCLQNGSCLMRS